MIALEMHPEIHDREIYDQGPRLRKNSSVCHECHQTFYARNEDQFCLELCDTCFDALRYLREPIISVRTRGRIDAL